jgi:hypothetical protein
MELIFKTSRPHREEDITAGKPIRFSMGEVELNFPMLSYKSFIDLDEGIRMLGAQTLIGDVYPDDSDFHSSIIRIYGENYDLKLFDERKLPTLPAFVLGKAEIQNRDNFIEVYNKWCIGIDRLNKGLKNNCSELDLKMALVQYFINNFSVVDCFRLFQDLLWLQSNIKKKVVEILQGEDDKGEKAQRLRPQLSSTMLEQWELIQKDRSERHLISSSSQ